MNNTPVKPIYSSSKKKVVLRTPVKLQEDKGVSTMHPNSNLPRSPSSQTVDTMGINEPVTATNLNGVPYNFESFSKNLRMKKMSRDIKSNY